MGGLALVLLVAATTVSASAAPAAVGLGTATPFAVLAGQSVSNTGPSLIGGDLGVSPGTAVTGFPPGLVVNGTVHSADAVALQAQNDLTTAYNDAAGRIPDVDKTNQDLGNQTLVAGVYGASSAMALTGTVTLDAQGDPDAVFIFQAGSTLITASNSTVALLNGAQACRVFWQVGSSATIGTNTSFVGTVMALTSVSMLTGADLQGRALARNGSVTLDDNTITRSDCPPVVGSTPTVSPTPTTDAGLLFTDSFDRADALITNEYAYWNPDVTTAAKSAGWEMDSGSFFARGGLGWTGVPDDVAPNATSSNGTNSAVFRLNTKEKDFGDVAVSFKLNVSRFVTTGQTPAVDWDGVHIWLRYQSEYGLYYASVARRDGSVVLKKKCPGGPSNGGTYYQIGTSSSGYPVPLGVTRTVTATVKNNTDGSVTIAAYINGTLVKKATDTGTGCAPITAPGATGIRGDNAEFTVDDYTVRAQ